MLKKQIRVFLKNGNFITCEIKTLEIGKLKCKTHKIGTVYVEWDGVDSLYSEKEFEIHLKNGSIIYTSFDSTYYKYKLYEWEDMIAIIQNRKNFWKRINGNADLGFSYAKSSDILQLNVDGNVEYNYLRWSASVDLNTLLTIDGDETRTDRKNIKFYLNDILYNN